MKKYFVFLVIVSVLIIGCKKKADSSIEAAVITPDDPTTFRGFLTSTTSTNSFGEGYYTGQGAEARFYAEPLKNLGPANEINLNFLSVNSWTLTNKDMATYMLIGPPHDLNLENDTWVVNGNSGIPSFTFTNAKPYPTCDSFTVIPDSISKSKGCTFTVDKVAGINSGFVSFGDGVAGVWTYSLVTGTNLIQIKPSDLAALTTGTLGGITIWLSNTTEHSVSGKNFQFIKEAYLTKPFTITP